MSNAHSKKAFSGEDYHNAYWVSATHSVAHVAKDGTFLDVNDAFCSLVGYTRAELLRKRFQDITDYTELLNDSESADSVVRGEIRSYGLDKAYRHKRGMLVRINLQVRRVPHSLELPFEHFVIFAYRKPPIVNLKHEATKEGELIVRTTTSWKDFVKDNKFAMFIFMGFISVLGFISGHFDKILEIVKIMME